MRINPDGTLSLTLYPVPKAMPELRRIWCPEACVVSFKLETDPTILREKSALAMERSGVPCRGERIVDQVREGVTRARICNDRVRDDASLSSHLRERRSPDRGVRGNSEARAASHDGRSDDDERW
ncbi:hypothetical protein ACHAW5_002233 [Stephanodiscus triporus]|uniref:Uncharacterized protein n=1 Tax=Stephanodiscus triporus TaxID=2934178 RepID=A0ABD3QLL9_9STRA